MCEFNDSRRKELETEFPGITMYKDYKELLKDTAIEAVSIVLPDNLHREAVELAVQAGKHILLEKPLAKELELSLIHISLRQTNHHSVHLRFAAGFPHS